MCSEENQILLLIEVARNSLEVIPDFLKNIAHCLFATIPGIRILGCEGGPARKGSLAAQAGRHANFFFDCSQKRSQKMLVRQMTKTGTTMRSLSFFIRHIHLNTYVPARYHVKRKILF